MLKYSIVLPCYNVSKYVTKCLESIIKNDMSSCEVLIIDDGSTDDTIEKCRDFISQYSSGGYHSASIEIISQENAGVSSARNLGIRHAQGEYIVFVDPDDEVDASLIDRLDKKISSYQNKPDLVIWGHWSINVDSSNRETARYQVLPNRQYELFSNKEVMDELFPRYIGYSVEQVQHWASHGSFEPKHEWGACWRVAYKRTLLVENRIYFNERIRLKEDSMFNENALVYTNSVVTIPEALYYYYIRNTGSMKKVLSGPLIENKKELFLERKRIVSLIQNPEIKADLSIYVGSIIFGIIEIMTSVSLREWCKISDLLCDSHVKQCIRYMPYVSNVKFSICLFLLKNHLSLFLFTLIQMLKRLNIKISA